MVKTVIVGGKVLVHALDGGRAEVLNADETAIRAEAQVEAEKVARRVATDPMHREMALTDLP